MSESNQFFIVGDCYEELENLIAAGYKFDAIITDSPYGITNNKGDQHLDGPRIGKLLHQLTRKPATPIILFAVNKFSAKLLLSNENEFRYKWYGNKRISTGFLQANVAPLSVVEEILVFSERMYENTPSSETGKKYDRIAQYFPVLEIGHKNHSQGNKTNQQNNTYNKYTPMNAIQTKSSGKNKGGGAIMET